MGKAYIYCFGETPQLIQNPGEWQDLFFEFNGLVRNILKSEDNVTFTCQKCGHYLINAFCNIQDDNTPTVISLRIIFNNADNYDIEISGGQRSLTLANSDMQVPLGIQLIYDLKVGDSIKFQINSTGYSKVWTSGVGMQPDNVGLIIQKL